MKTFQKGGEKMIPRAVSIELSLWETAKQKAKPIALSRVIRALLKAWLRGKINLDSEDYE